VKRPTEGQLNWILLQTSHPCMHPAAAITSNTACALETCRDVSIL